MKTLLTLFLLIPSLSWGLTFKDGQQVDGNEKTRDKVLKSKEISSDNIIGRWRGLANCEWHGRYELGNGIIEGVVDLVIKRDKKDPNKIIIKKEKWLWPSHGGRVRIKSFKVSENSFEIESKEPKEEENIRKWYGKMTSNNHIEVVDEGNKCDALLYRVENISFEAFTPKIPIDFIDGIENDQKYTIQGFLTYPQEHQEKYPLMILIMNSACDFGQRNFTLGQDIKKGRCCYIRKLIAVFLEA